MYLRTAAIICGVIAYFFILASIMTGMRIIKIKVKWHNFFGKLTFVFATLHIILILMFYYL